MSDTKHIDLEKKMGRLLFWTFVAVVVVNIIYVVLIAKTL